MKKKKFSICVYIVNIAMLFFPWIEIGAERYNLLMFAIRMHSLGTKALIEQAGLGRLSIEEISGFKLGITVELIMFLLFVIFCLGYIVTLLKEKHWRFDAAALCTAIACVAFNGFGYTILALCSNSIFAMVFPVVFMVLTAFELLIGGAIEAWDDMVKENRRIQQREEDYKKEVKERLGEEKKYTSLYYHVVWKNFKKNWRDYFLLLASSLIVFSFILAGFGMQSILSAEHSDEDMFLFKGIGTIVFNALVPLGIISVFIIVLLLFYYLKCRAKNYGVFLTLGMRKKNLYYFVAVEFIVGITIILLAGGIIGYGIIFLVTKESSKVMSVALHMADAGILTYLKAVAVILVTFLVSAMATRDIFYSFNIGQSADLRAIREKMPGRVRKLLFVVGIAICVYCVCSYSRISNYEGIRYLAECFLGIFLVLRYGAADYLIRERKKQKYLNKLLDHSELYHKSKTGTGYMAALTIVQICILFYFPTQIISTMIAEDAEQLYPYDIVCFADEGDDTFFEELKSKYDLEIDIYPMVRVSNMNCLDNKFFGSLPVQGQHIGISETTYHELKRKLDPDYDKKSLGLDKEGESVYIVHQQDKTVRAQPVDYEDVVQPILHVGEPSQASYTIYSIDPNYYPRVVKGEEIGSLIGCFHQGGKENIIVFSDEFFEVAKDMWKTRDANTGDIFMSEEEKIPGETLRQGPARLVLINAAEKDITNVVSEVSVFAEEHEYNQPFNLVDRMNGVKTYDSSIKNYYDKQTAVKNLETERIMKIMMNAMVLLVFFIISIILICIKMLTESEMNQKRAEFLTCMGMREKARIRLLRKEIFIYYFILPTILAAITAAGFAAAVFIARMYTIEDILNYLKIMMPYAGIYFVGYAGILWILVTAYVHRVERSSYERKELRKL